MKVKIQGFLGTNHSWSLVQQNIARALLKKGHDVHLNSTNGIEHFPDDLKPYLKSEIKSQYDMQISYTAMHNFPEYLSHGNKNRFGIWNYETTVLPKGFAKYYKATDKFLPSSNFSKKIFADNQIPEEHMEVIPHGADLDAFKNKKKYPLKTKKKFKILANIAQPHIRKNIPGLLSAFGKAFDSTDDVCLVAKVSVKKDLNMLFEVDFKKLLHAFNREFPKHAELELITNFIPDITELYNSCDAVLSMTHAECFWLPGIESMAAGKLTIAPNYGGQLDFMNQFNSLLIPGKIIASPQKMQYWTASPYAAMFDPNIDEAVQILKKAYREYDSLITEFAPKMKETISIYSWDNVTNKILQLCK